MKKKILSFALTLLIIVCFTGCSKSNEAEPILKVVTSTQVGFFLGNKSYYVVYDNGSAKKTKKFDFSTSVVEVYGFNPNGEDKSSLLLDITDVTTEKGRELNKIAHNILEYSNDKKFSPKKLYRIEQKYYFTAFSEKARKKNEIIYVYNDLENSAKELASFDNDIISVQPYVQ